MIKLYYSTAPNPVKVAMFLEEAGLPYEAIPVDTRKGEQFAPDFLKINPNAKVPAIVDGDTVVFDSNAILLHLGETTGQFMPQGGADGGAKARGELLSWMMFIASGVGPFSGQAVHFKHMAAEKLPYAIDRYVYEVKRHYGVLDTHLKDRRYLVDETYTIADMSLWGWARMLAFILGEDAWDAFPNVKRLYDEISARPAAAKVKALMERHAFKKDMDAEARRNLFKHVAA